MSLHEVRADLVATLREITGPVEVQVYDYVPARFSPPALTVLPASPYVTPDDRFGHIAVHHTVTVVVPPGANDVVTRAADKLIEDVLVALVTAGTRVEQVSTFYSLDIGGTSYLAADVYVHRSIRL